MPANSPDRPPQPVLHYATDSGDTRPDELAPLTPGMRVVRALLLLASAIVVGAIVLAINAMRIWGVG